MSRWAKIRWVLRGLAAGLGAVALAPVPGGVAVVAGVLAAALGGLTVDLPRSVK